MYITHLKLTVVSISFRFDFRKHSEPYFTRSKGANTIRLSNRALFFSLRKNCALDSNIYTQSLFVQRILAGASMVLFSSSYLICSSDATTPALRQNPDFPHTRTSAMRISHQSRIACWKDNTAEEFAFTACTCRALPCPWRGLLPFACKACCDSVRGIIGSCSTLVRGQTVHGHPLRALDASRLAAVTGSDSVARKAMGTSA